MGCYDLTTYFTVVSACLTIILTTVLIFILFQIKKSFLAFQSLFQHYEEEHNTVQIDKSQLTSYELERLEREEEFESVLLI
jgi:LPS O-antigen subunit length determinant protein (WzzB/FepE family)